MKELDPKAIARRKFVQPDTEGIDVIGRYATDPPLVVRTLLDAIEERAGAGSRVIELGFGSGWLLEEMARELPEAQLYGLDMSWNSAVRAKKLYGGDVDILVGDMERLPLAKETFDVIVTCWTLYFMRDIDSALGELKRCLKPAGRLVAATNAPDHEVEFGRLVAEAVRAAVDSEPEPDIGERFDLVNGAAPLRRRFASVEIREWRGEMAIDVVAPVLTLWRNWLPQSLTESESERAFDAFAEIVAREMEREGALRVTRHGGAFVADAGEA